MCALPNPLSSSLDRPTNHDGFLAIFPAVVRHAHFIFRRLPTVEREEAEAEAVAAAFQSYVRLKEQGKDPSAFPTVLACYAALHVQNGRRVGGRQNKRDVLSSSIQRRHGVRVMHLDSDEARLSEALRDDTRTPVPDQVAFRVDFPAWLRTLTERHRRMAAALARGDAAKEVARRFGVSPVRVTQLRQYWQRQWQVFRGDAVAGVGRVAS
jgi:hypothetical protein